MKKSLITVICVIAVLAAVYIVGSGFIKNSSVYIDEFTISENGDQITFNAGVSSSVGFIRKAAVHQQHGGRLYIDFYSAFGGFNGSIGAKSTFTLPLDADTDEIAVYAGGSGYRTVLEKGTDGEWRRPA